MNGTKNSSSRLLLNALPVTFSANEVAGFVLDYQGEDHLRSLQDKHKDLFLIKRAGKNLFIIPLRESVQFESAESHIFTTRDDWSLFERLLEEGIRKFISSKYQTLLVPTYGPLWLKIKGEKHDLVHSALASQKHTLRQLEFLHIYRKYGISAIHFRKASYDEPAFALQIKISTSWQISISIADLHAKGIELTGCYAIPLSSATSELIGYKLLGRIAKVEDQVVHLADFRDTDKIDPHSHTIEASLENVNKCVRAVLGQRGPSIMQLLRAEVGRLLGVEGQLHYIQRLANVFGEDEIPCALNLTATVSKNALSADIQGSYCTTVIFDPPRYILKNRGNPIVGPIAPAIAIQGPYDQDSFQKTTPHIAVICPKQHLGRVEQFMKAWRDGKLNKPYNKGFVEQYKLRGCDFRFIDFDEISSDVGEHYRQACLRALAESRDIVRRYDLAFVITAEGHRLLGKNDPYLISKAGLMNQGVPVQEIEIETVDMPLANRPFVLNNLGLVSYAKLGGTPWLLSSNKGPGITHELVIGLGSATVRNTRLQGVERYVGITTLFNYDGVYLLSNVSGECEYDEYPEKLKATLVSSLEYVSIQKGWQPGERVRLVFHTFKPLGNVEIETVKYVVQKKLGQFLVDFAFLTIGQHHPWVVYRPDFQGLQKRSGRTVGKGVPARGTMVTLDESRTLLCITGPDELKWEDHGCPAPLQISLHGASTFQDTRYLAEQVFTFSYMSWKTFNLEPMPVTISYSEAIARLLGRLRDIKNWNSDVLETTQLRTSLWFA